LCYNKSMKKKLDILFDVDGTLMDIEHRRHFVSNGNKDWDSFRSHTEFDTPVEHVFAMAKMLQQQGHRIHVLSGRNVAQRAITLKQLLGNGLLPMNLLMRADGDFRSDDVVKEEFLDNLIEQGFEPTMAFDDRQQVVDMWRRRGLTCFQVAEGNF